MGRILEDNYVPTNLLKERLTKGERLKVVPLLRPKESEISNYILFGSGQPFHVHIVQEEHMFFSSCICIS